MSGWVIEYVFAGGWVNFQNVYVDASISRDERDASSTQYITNAGISRVRYTITHFKPPLCSNTDFQSNKYITSLYRVS